MSLLLLRKRPLFRDTFGGVLGASLSDQWTAALGAFELDGAGRARGKTLAADGNELLANIGFETAGAGGADVFANWTENAGDGAIARTTVAGEFHSGVAACKLARGAAAGVPAQVDQVITVVPGVTYTLTFWTRGDGTNAGRYYIYDVTNGAVIVDYTETGVTGAAFAQKQVTFTAPAGCVSARMQLLCPAANSGWACFDDTSLQATLAIATHDLARANHDLRWRFITPAAGVVPGGLLVRYQDTSNYWLWRVKPGTAGNDLELVEVNAGVATVRAGADIDWVAATAYELRLVTRGNVYTAYVNGVSKGTYTDAGSFLATNTVIGLWAAGVGNILTDQLIAKAA